MRDNDDTYDDRLRNKLRRAAAQLAEDDLGTLNLKIATTALSELHNAFRVFSPFRNRRKVTVFGSARVAQNDPLYGMARGVSNALAGRGWMVVTGAGPGIMQAGFEGAGSDNSLGVSIQLPFEASEGAAMLSPERTAAMKYFFTRKLMLCKESHAFIALPGGFGTQDEVFELLTLVQTGKSDPVPIVLLDAPGGSYWREWLDFVRRQLAHGGYISEDDLGLLYVTDDVDDAAAHVERFYRVYDSCRFVHNKLVLRLNVAPTDDVLRELNEQFADLCAEGAITLSEPTTAERADEEKLDLQRLVLTPYRGRTGRLRALIDRLNDI